jgi:hypothetical protein
MSKALQFGNPEGRVDLLAVRLLECAIKARMGLPSDATLLVDFLHVGETVSRRFGYHREFVSLRSDLERLADECGVQTVQTFPELAHNLGLLRGRRGGGKRGGRCTR